MHKEEMWLGSPFWPLDSPHSVALALARTLKAALHMAEKHKGKLTKKERGASQEAGGEGEEKLIPL